MSTLLRILVATGLLAGAAACGSSEPAHSESREAVRLRTEAAKTTTVAASFEAGGTVRARTIAVLSSRIVAPVVEVRTGVGTRVRRGQPLVVLDARDLRAASDRAEASLLVAKQSADAAAAEEQGAAAALTLAKSSHQRVASLRERNSATAGELDEAVAALRGAEARARGAAARRVEAERAIEAARAGAQAATVGASYAVIAAPFDGVVTSKSTDPGNMAVPGAPLLTVEDDRRFQVEVSLDASRVARLAPGAAVAVSVDALGGESLKGTVTEVAAAADPIAHTVIVKIDLPPAEGLRTGLFARARLAGAPQTAVTVPASSIARRGQLTLVFVAEEGVARMRLVHAGAEADGRVAILSGLSEGERVVLDPPATLLDGTPLASADATPAAHGAGRRP